MIFNLASATVGLIFVIVNGPLFYQTITRHSGLLYSPPENLRHFTFGYHETVADILWLRAIQDFDICEADRERSANEPNRQDSSEQTSLNVNSQPSARPLGPRCQKGWVFRMLMGITELAPDFRAPYLSGAINLSVIVDDIKGATALFEKGLLRIKDDWVFDYRAAYHFMIEEKQGVRAAHLLVDAGRKGAPQWVFALAARLMSREGQLALARSVLEEQIRTQTDEDTREMFRKKLAEIERANSQAR